MPSSAIERYLKAVIVVLTGKVKKVHLDKLSVIQKQLEGTTHEGLFKYFDEVFFDVLSKAYKFRYLDNLNEPATIGFFVNQFLGELDYTVSLFEKLIKVKDAKGQPWKSPYKRAVESNKADLFQCNHVLNGLNKKEFMESESLAYGLHYDPAMKRTATIKLKEKLPVEYSGCIMGILANFTDEAEDEHG